MSNQVPGTCRRFFEFCFDVDDTERMTVRFCEPYDADVWPCEIVIEGEVVAYYPDYDVPHGCIPDITIAEIAATHYLKFNELKP